MKKTVWLIGPGNIGLDYAKVLRDQNVDFKVIGRSPRPNWPVKVYEHGLTMYIKENNKQIPQYAIVAVDESQLHCVTMELIQAGIKNILIEKPAGICIEQVNELFVESKNKVCSLFVAYNRRFYQSVKRCKEIITECNGPMNISFTFTEWAHAIPFDWYNTEELSRFFLCNSSHVPDTVFYLGGPPRELHCYTRGSLPWHPSASVFSGCGITTKDIPITYNANWGSAGRWGIEIDLPDKKLILRPLEKLQIQPKGTLEAQPVDLPNEELDLKYKPGLFEEVNSFLTNQKDLCTIKQQLDNFLWYYKMANYL